MQEYMKLMPFVCLRLFLASNTMGIITVTNVVILTAAVGVVTG